MSKRSLSDATTAHEPLRASTAADATSLADCATLNGGLPSATAAVLMPWVGFGTYKLGQSAAKAATLAALRCGYRAIDTAYIYAGEKCEPEVGKAIATALSEGTLRSREELFVTTKHWRKFHGYDETLKCLNTSLQRLQLEHVDLWLMHWPGPAWSTMNRKKDEIAAHGPWFYAASGHGADEIAALRAETWRAMEEALKAGKCRAIGVSNFTVAHLETVLVATNFPFATRGGSRPGCVFFAQPSVKQAEGPHVKSWRYMATLQPSPVCCQIDSRGLPRHRLPSRGHFSDQRSPLITPWTVCSGYENNSAPPSLLTASPSGCTNQKARWVANTAARPRPCGERSLKQLRQSAEQTPRPHPLRCPRCDPSRPCHTRH